MALDLAIQTFFTNSPDGLIGVLFAVPIIIIIFVSIIKPFDV